ncbi:MAG TPA: hypothetical protein PLV13_12110, partial [Ilumatobacteraceae bacterium]|nr:hypothetical protein [Ilumatobacteraceae bacterium]
AMAATSSPWAIGIAAAAAAAPASATPPTTAEKGDEVPLPTSMAEVFDRLLGGAVEARPLGGIVFDPSRNPTGKDVEQVDLADAVMVLASIAPRSMSTPPAGLTFLIQAPPGSEARVLDAIKMLQFFNCNVKWIRFDGPVQEETVFLVTQQSIQQQAEDSGAVEPFGAAHFEVTENPIEDVDVIMQLGAAFLNGTGGIPTSVPSDTTGSSVPGSTVPGSTVPGTTGG